MPYFLLDASGGRDLNFAGIANSIQIIIEPRDNHAIVVIVLQIFSDADSARGCNPDGRRLESFIIFNGVLPRDEDRIEAMLEIAHVTFLEILGQDFFDVPQRKEK